MNIHGHFLISKDIYIDISFIDTWAGSSEHIDPTSGLFEKGLAEDPNYILNIFMENINKVMDIYKLKESKEESIMLKLAILNSSKNNTEKIIGSLINNKNLEKIIREDPFDKQNL